MATSATVLITHDQYADLVRRLAFLERCIAPPPPVPPTPTLTAATMPGLRGMDDIELGRIVQLVYQTGKDGPRAMHDGDRWMEWVGDECRWVKTHPPSFIGYLPIAPPDLRPWTPVGEGLPAGTPPAYERRDVEVRLSDGSERPGWHDGSEWVVKGPHDTEQYATGMAPLAVTHWRELPPLPGGGA
jgi:hypothetical protein